MKKRIILDLCGGTGSWSKPYKDAGYEVITITLPDYDVTKVDFMENGMNFISNKDTISLQYNDIYGILSAPPCTEFSRAKAFHGKGNYTNDFAKGLETVVACLKIISMCSPDWWCMENPNGYLKRWMGKETASFEPWEFGDNYQKNTLLWGNFRMPKPSIHKKPKGLKKFSLLKSKEIAPEFYGIYDRTVRRSITPSSFAKAFYQSNK